jgi:hypothetical protein
MAAGSGTSFPATLPEQSRLLASIYLFCVAHLAGPISPERKKRRGKDKGSLFPCASHSVDATAHAAVMRLLFVEQIITNHKMLLQGTPRATERYQYFGGAAGKSNHSATPFA